MTCRAGRAGADLTSPPLPLPQAPSGQRPVYDWTSREYSAAGTVGPLLSRVDAYFHYLRIPEEDCRRRTICQLARRHDEFEPVSGLLLRALRCVSDSQRLTT